MWKQLLKMLNTKMPPILSVSQKWLSSFSRLILPNNCLLCENELIDLEENICVFCVSKLPYTLFEKMEGQTALDKLFWGRISIENSFSLLFFEKQGLAQPLLHAIKYQHQKHLAIQMGVLIGKRWMEKACHDPIDALVPIPLHHKRQFSRGYNQSAFLAKGIGIPLQIPVLEGVLERAKNVKTQTKLNRFQRWNNVSEIFEAKCLPEEIKHIALVDDVITTGATLEAACRVLNEKFPELRISIISLAIAL